MPPALRPRPGSVTSSASPASCFRAAASAIACAALGEQRLDRFLGRVDARAGCALFFGRQLAEPFEQLGERAALAEIARLRVFERSRAASARRRTRLRASSTSWSSSVIHLVQTPKKRRPCISPVLLFVVSGQQRSSERGFGLFDERRKGRLVEHRDVGQNLAIDSISAFFKPFMNTL